MDHLRPNCILCDSPTINVNNVNSDGSSSCLSDTILLQLFYTYFKIGHPDDGVQNRIRQEDVVKIPSPFCSRCRGTLWKCHRLQEQLISIQNEISNVLSDVSMTILEKLEANNYQGQDEDSTNFGGSSYSSFSNINYPESSRPVKDLELIKELRRSICTRYVPRVLSSTLLNSNPRDNQLVVLNSSSMSINNKVSQLPPPPPKKKNVQGHSHSLGQGQSKPKSQSQSTTSNVVALCPVQSQSSSRLPSNSLGQGQGQQMEEGEDQEVQIENAIDDLFKAEILSSGSEFDPTFDVDDDDSNDHVEESNLTTTSVDVPKKRPSTRSRPRSKSQGQKSANARKRMSERVDAELDPGYTFKKSKYKLKDLLVDSKNNSYSHDGNNKTGGAYYRCVKRTMGCMARGTWSTEGFILTRKHSHEPPPVQ